LEKKYGSLFSGMNGGRSVLSVLLHPKKPAESPFLSLRRGLGSLIDALFECALSPQARSGPSLPQSPPIRLSSPVRRLLAPEAGEPAGVELSSGERLAGRHIVVAGPPWVAAALLGESQLARELSGIRGFPTATVFFGLRQAEVSSDLQGSGFIVPPGEGKILASTWVSSKWEGRAAPGTALVRAFVGGARTPELAELPDSQLLDLAQGELTRLMGSLGRPLFRRVFRYERGTPQPELGHTERLAELRRGLQVRPWLSVIGSGYGAVGIPDCIRQAREVTEGLLKGDPPGPEASGRAS
jgi:oxygen-dependent protoporphyrinogen oxidase